MRIAVISLAAGLVFAMAPPADAEPWNWRDPDTVDPDPPAPGWNAPALAAWLGESAGEASKAFFGKEACYMGEGGSIPFMGMLGEKFPEAQFLITGVLGPHSNAHGPNEFLEISTGKNVTACTAKVLADHFKRK